MLRISFYLLLTAAIAVVGLAGAVLWWVMPQLPSASSLREVRLQTPLRVYTRDGSLIAEFGEKRRNPLAIDEVPALVKQAFIAAEDDRFYEHPGVDWMAIVRAGLDVARSHEKRQGGSTITMQLARNFFLSREKTYQRKLKEIVLAVKIERELSKDQILELYLNKIFLGQRAYGVGAAAQVYYGTTLDKLSVAEIAMIAGLPKAPSNTNPIANPDAAMARRSYVLRRMFELDYIDEATYQNALDAPQTARLHAQQSETNAPHLAEMVRHEMQAKYGDAVYTSGYRVFTTVSSDLQAAAVQALRRGLIDYDRRHGYRGPEATLVLEGVEPAQRAGLLRNYPLLGGLTAALVVEVRNDAVEVVEAGGDTRVIPWKGLAWARPYINEDAVGAAPRHATDLVKPGDVIRIEWMAPVDKQEGYWRLAQVPVVEGALVSIASRDGAIQALAGGFDFDKSKFNRVTQALRQPGSNFKPFIYSAALDHGFTAASFVNDAPIVFDTPGLEEAWRPENYSGTYYGPTRLREALANSRNLVSIRVMRDVGIKTTLRHVSGFGFNPDTLPGNLSLSLGTGELTPLQLVTGYAAFSNGGFRVEPYFIERIELEDGTRVSAADPLIACDDCAAPALDDEGEPVDVEALQAQSAQRVAPRAVDAQNAYMMYSMMKDVISRGTGRRALELKRSDLAGKTGTTNDQKDAWFSGLNGRIATTVWIGFDQVAPLGRAETGARAALPVWIDYMRVALKDMPPTEPSLPPGVVTVRIDPASGAVAGVGNPRAILETFREKDVPRAGASSSVGYSEPRAIEAEQLF
jgi:penicillin-binding protein 1A